MRRFSAYQAVVNLFHEHVLPQSPIVYTYSAASVRSLLTEITRVTFIATSAVGLLMLYSEQYGIALACAVIVLIQAITAVLLSQNYAYLALTMNPITLFVGITVSAVIVTDIHGIFFGFYGTVVVITGAIIGLRAALLALLITISSGMVLFFMFDGVQQTQIPMSTRWVLGSMNVMISFVSIYLILYYLSKTYNKLKSANEQLVETRDKLHRRTAELSAYNQALQNSEKTKKAILDSIPDMMALIDINGVYIDYKAFAYFREEDPPESVIGLTVHDKLSPERAETRMSYVRRVIETDEIIEYEESLPVRGNIHHFSSRIVGVNGVYALIIVRDVTNIKKQEASQLAAQKSESIGILAGGIAHDFNNLLTGMMAQTSVAMRKLPPDHAVQAHIQKANIAAQRAADLTRQLLAYAGRGSLRVERLNINTIIGENVALLRAGLPATVEIVTHFHEQLPLIEADRGQIQQLVMNLIINAAEATADGHVHIATYYLTQANIPQTIYFLDEDAPPAEQYICFIVSDTGQGMGADTLSRIFDPFFSRKQGGRGLGLAASLGIIRRYKGGIQVESQKGHGTTFTILLPSEPMDETDNKKDL